MIDTSKYEGHTPGPWGRDYDSVFEYDGEDIARLTLGNEANEQLIADAPLLLTEVKRLRDGIRSILSDYDITELIRDVPEDEWNFEQQALVRMKEMVE